MRAVPRCQRAQVAEHRLVVYRHSILLLETIDNRTFEKRSVEIPLDYSGVVGVLARCNHHRMALLTALEQVRAQLRTYANNVTLLASRHEVARGHCDRRPRDCCMSHSDELPSANALSALQHHLSATLSLSPFRTVTRLHHLNLDLKHICSPPSTLLNCPVRQRL